MQVQGSLKLAKLHLISWTWYNLVSDQHMKGLGDMIDGLLPSGMINRETFLSLTSLSHLTHLSNFQGSVFILKYIHRTCWKRVPKVNHLPGAAWHLNAVVKWYRLISAASHFIQSTPLQDTWQKTWTWGPGLSWKRVCWNKSQKGQWWCRWGKKSPLRGFY